VSGGIGCSELGPPQGRAFPPWLCRAEEVSRLRDDLALKDEELRSSRAKLAGSEAQLEVRVAASALLASRSSSNPIFFALLTGDEEEVQQPEPGPSGG
jgi:hypothetical protein